jgi:hypothetical protein
VKYDKNACGGGIGHIGYGGRGEVAAISGLFDPERLEGDTVFCLEPRRGDETLRTDTVEVDDGTHTAVCPPPHA